VIPFTIPVPTVEGREKVTHSEPGPALVPAASEGQDGSVRMLRGALVPAMVIGLVAAGVFWASHGEHGALSSLMATVVTLAFFAGGTWGLRFILGGGAGLALAGALVVYLGQLIAVTAVFLVLRQLAWVQPMPFALSAIAVTITWQIGAIVGFSRARLAVGRDDHE
jgi:ATP synthase protein I